MYKPTKRIRELLKSICADDGYLKKPILENGSTIYAQGRMCVTVEGYQDPDARIINKCMMTVFDKEWSKSFKNKSMKGLDIPNLEPLTCKTCSGHGYFSLCSCCGLDYMCDCDSGVVKGGRDQPCPKCKGTGKAIQQHEVKIGDRSTELKFIAIAKKLPGFRFGYDDNKYYICGVWHGGKVKIMLDDITGNTKYAAQFPDPE